MTQGMTFTSFESSGGAKIYRIPMEVFPNFWAYAYAVIIDDFRVLIDTGSGIEKSHQDLLEGLQRAGIQPPDLTHIVLTHAHIDHYGGLSPLRTMTQARIGVHELDLQTVAHHDAWQTLQGRRFASFLAETGVPEEQRGYLLGMYHLPESFYRSVSVDFTYETVDLRLGPLEFLHLPGHCPGHVAIRLDDVVFCGDMVVEGITPHLSPESVTPYSGLGHYLDSLARFQQWAKDALLILNGHDEAITDLSAKIEATRENILRRMGKGMDALGEALTIEEVCSAIYGKMEGYNQLLIIEKTGAYIEYLFERGLIGISNPEEMAQAKPARYCRLREVSESELIPKERAYVFI